MKKFAKILCAVLCAATAAGVLAACKPKQPAPTPPDGGDNPPVVDPTPVPPEFQGVTEAMPTDGLKVSALSNMKEASSVWQAKYEADAFRVTVWVKDEIVVANEDLSKSDGVKIGLSEVSETSGYVAGKTVSLFASPDGAVKFQRATDAKTLADCTDEISVSVKEWAESGETVVGYKVDAAFPYAALGVSAAEAKGNISIAAELSNTSSEAFTAAVRGAGLNEYGVDPENQNTYLVVEDDNEFALNSDPYPTGTFHYKKNVYDRTESLWDVSEDYLASNPKYGDRRAELKGSLGTGKWNELWFYREKSTLFYAESDFSLPANPVYFGDQYPKFGFTLYDENKNGVFFYFDTLSDLTGKSVGYTIMTRGSFDWDGAKHKNIDWSPAQKLKLGIFRNGGMIKLLVNGEVVFTLDGTSGLDAEEALTPAVFSFNLGVILTDYRITTDEHDAKIEELNQKLPAFDGTITHDYALLDSTNADVDLTAYGALDWAVYNHSLNPYDRKQGGALIGEAGANAAVKSFKDFLYQNSSLSWTDGTATPSRTQKGDIAGLTLNGAGSKFVLKFNVVTGKEVNYFVWFGGYEAKTNIRMTDARGNVLFTDAVGSKTGRTVGRLQFTVTAAEATEISLELTVDDDVAVAPQVWLLAISAIETKDLPKDPTQIGVNGTVTANMIGRARNSESIDMTKLGTKDWVHYGKASSTDAYRKAGEKGYFGALQCLATYNGMDDFFLGDDVHLSFSDGAAPDASKTFRDRIPALAMPSERGVMVQYLFVKANEPVRFTLWAASWIGSAVGVKVYDANKTWYQSSINIGNKIAAIDITVTSAEDACLMAEFTASDQIWYLGGTAGAPETNAIPSAEFTGTAKARFTLGERNNLQINLSETGSKDWIYFGKSTVAGYERKNNAPSYFGKVSFVNQPTAYPFGDFLTDAGSLAYTDGTLANERTYSGGVPALSLFGAGGKIVLPLAVKGSESFSYFLWMGAFNGSASVNVTTASGKSVLKNPVSIGGGSGATVGCLRLDLKGVSESVLYVETTCTGQEIWLCAAAAGQTPVDPDAAFEGSLKTVVNPAARSNTTLDLTRIGTYDWNVYETNVVKTDDNSVTMGDYAKKNVQNPMIDGITIKTPLYTSGSFGDYFYQNAGTVSWSDGNAGHESMNKTGDFPALTVTIGWRLTYSIPEDFKGTIYLWVGYWTTIADMRVTDVDGALLDFVRFGDAFMGNLYEVKINVDSRTKTKIYVDFETMEAGAGRGLWLFGTAVGDYAGDTAATPFDGSVAFEGASLDRENVSLNFTQEGALDWVAYNNGSVTDFESKNTHAVSPYIGELTLGAYTEISKEENFFYNNSGIVSWTDGTKEASFTTAAGSAFPAIQAGFKSASFTLALKAEAGKTIRYTVYTGGWHGQVAANLSDANGVIGISRAYGSRDNADTLKIEVCVTSKVDTTVYLRVYKVTTDYNYNAATNGANLMLMGVTAQYAALSAFGGTATAKLTASDRFNSTIDVTAAGKDDWRVYNKSDRFAYYTKNNVAYNYVGALSFEGKIARHFDDFLYQNQGVVSWTDGTEGAYTSAVGDSVGGLTTQDTFVLRLNAKAGEAVKFTVWLGGYNNPDSVYALFTEDGRELVSGKFGADGTGYVGCLELNVENETDCTLVLKISANRQESWLFGAAASIQE